MTAASRRGAFGQLVGFGVDLLDLCQVVGVAEPGVEVLEDGGIFSEYFIVVNERVRRALHLFLHQFGEALVQFGIAATGLYA